MNTVDMHSRETVNKLNLDKMHQEAKIRQMLQQANQEVEAKQPVHTASSHLRAILEQLSALVPHHVPHRHPVNHAK